MTRPYSLLLLLHPSYVSGVHIFGGGRGGGGGGGRGVIFAYVTVFNPTIEIVTFCLCGWCMLGVCLLPAFTRLGHECQDLLSPCDGMHVCTD